MWGNTVIANGTALGIVIYTGRETRSVINNSQPRSKVGLFDLEINFTTKVRFLEFYKTYHFVQEFHKLACSFVVCLSLKFQLLKIEIICVGTLYLNDYFKNYSN